MIKRKLFRTRNGMIVECKGGASSWYMTVIEGGGNPKGWVVGKSMDWGDAKNSEGFYSAPKSWKDTGYDVIARVKEEELGKVITVTNNLSYNVNKVLLLL